MFLAIASPLLLRAQFQKSTNEELTMTEDPKAPGAAAVYLNYEETIDETHHDHKFYARIKVLQEKGKELATIDLGYLFGVQNITGVEGRTIHSDGTVIPMTVKADDLLLAKSGDFKVNHKVFTLPSVEVGSILEYSYELSYGEFTRSEPRWDVQRKYFAHKEHFYFIPLASFFKGPDYNPYIHALDEHGNIAENILWWPILPPGAEVIRGGLGGFILDLTDIPAAPDEEYMPPIDSILYHVDFYYTTAHTTDAFWNSESKSWTKDVDRFADPSSAIKQAVSGLIAPGDSDLDKAKKLYKAVQAFDNTDYSRAKEKSEIKQLGLKMEKNAADVLSQKSGNSRDITLLYLAMLRAAGLTAYDVRVIPRNRGIFSPGYMRFGQLTDDLVLVNAGGKNLLLDPGEKMCPFQTVSWEHSGATGVRQSPDDRFSVTTPFQDYKLNTLLRVGAIAFDEHNAMTGFFRFVMTGQEALLWRQTALRNDLDEVKKQFDHELESLVPEGVEAHVDSFQALDDPDANLVAIIKAHGALGSATSKRLLLPGFFFETRGHQPFVDQEKRQYAVDMHYGEQITDQITYVLPPGYAMEGAPQDAEIPWAGHADFVTKTVPTADKITIARQLTRVFTLAKPEEYQDLRGFYQKVAAADQQQLVLTKSAAPKGN
jgi:hypothetical protein